MVFLGSSSSMMMFLLVSVLFGNTLLLHVRADDDDAEEAAKELCLNETEMLYAEETAVSNATSNLMNSTVGYIPPNNTVEVLKMYETYEDDEDDTTPLPYPDECFETTRDRFPSLVCVFDYTNLTSDLAQACEAEGGQVHTDEVKFVCQSTSGHRAELSYFNYTSCWAASCDDPEKFFEESMEGIEEDIEAEVGYNCLLQFKFDESLGNSPATVVTPSVPLLLTAGTTMVVVLSSLSMFA